MESPKYFELKKSLAERSDTASFYLTARRCDKSLQRNQPDNDEDAGWTWVMDTDESAEQCRDIVVCHGLAQLEQFLEEIDYSVCLYPGFPAPSEIFTAKSEVRPWKDVYERFLSLLLGHTSELAFLFPEQRCLACFEVDSDSPSPENAWEKLCSIDPQLKDVGYLVTTYPISYGDHDKPAYRYRFYCVADDGSDLRAYKAAFMVKSNLHYPFSFVAAENGFFYLKQWVNPLIMSPDCEIHGREFFLHCGEEYDSSLKSGVLLKTSALDEATEDEWSRLDEVINEVLNGPTKTVSINLEQDHE